jgi:hypothetical protein
MVNLILKLVPNPGRLFFKAVVSNAAPLQRCLQQHAHWDQGKPYINLVVADARPSKCKHEYICGAYSQCHVADVTCLKYVTTVHSGNLSTPPLFQCNSEYTDEPLCSSSPRCTPKACAASLLGPVFAFQNSQQWKIALQKYLRRTRDPCAKRVCNGCSQTSLAPFCSKARGIAAAFLVSEAHARIPACMEQHTAVLLAPNR